MLFLVDVGAIIALVVSVETSNGSNILSSSHKGFVAFGDSYEGL